MPPGASPAPVPDRQEIERCLADAVEQARTEMLHASDRKVRAAAAQRLKAAVQELIDFTLRK